MMPQANLTPCPPVTTRGAGGCSSGNQSGGLPLPAIFAASYSFELPGTRTVPSARTEVGWTLSGMLNAQSGSPAGTLSAACACSSRAIRNGTSVLDGNGDQDGYIRSQAAALHQGSPRPFSPAGYPAQRKIVHNAGRRTTEYKGNGDHSDFETARATNAGIGPNWRAVVLHRDRAKRDGPANAIAPFRFRYPRQTPCLQPHPLCDAFSYCSSVLKPPDVHQSGRATIKFVLCRSHLIGSVFGLLGYPHFL